MIEEYSNKSMTTYHAAGHFTSRHPSDVLFGASQTAQILGVSETTLRAWRRAGRIQPTMTTAGGHYRWSLADIDAFIDAQKQVKSKSKSKSK